MKDRMQFRIWDKEEEQMIKFNLFTHPIPTNLRKATLTAYNSVHTDVFEKNLKLSRFIFMQSSGMRHNNKLIYEGDILFNSQKDIYYQVGYEKGILGFWGDGMNNTSICEILSKLVNNPDIKLLGNIYQNEDLIKKSSLVSRKPSSIKDRMRFRVWNRENEQMRYFDLLTKPMLSVSVEENLISYGTMYDEVFDKDVIEPKFVLMQSTGSFNHGRLIYEHDILLNEEKNIYYEVIYEQKIGGFYGVNMDDNNVSEILWDLLNNSFVKLIGNVHQL
jgi:hypothetical protein